MSFPHILPRRKRTEAGVDELKQFHLYVAPVVMLAAIAEGVILMRSPRGFDWKSWGCSLADLIGRQVLGFFPIMLAAPVFAVAYRHRLFTLAPDSVVNVLLLFIGLEFFYYWYHR